MLVISSEAHSNCLPALTPTFSKISTIVKNISSTADLSVISKNKPVTKIVGIIFMGLSLAVSVMPAAMAETFSIDGMALNTNNNFQSKDGHPIMFTWKLNPNDNDQQFDRQGQLLRHRSTGKCLNAYQPSVGSIVNVYPCNGNDGDQKFAILSAGGNVNLIQRVGTNLCLDMDSRNANTRMKLWDCNANFANQRFVSNASGNNSDQAARDQAARDQAARDQAARDQAARDQAARDQAARDQAARGQRASQRKVNDFVSQWNGKTRITRYDIGGNGYDGQCVTLIARYLQDHYGASKRSLSIDDGRGTAASVGRQFPNSFLPLSDPSDPIAGSIISFPQMAGSYGHVALVVNSQRSGNTLTLTILESNMDYPTPAPNSKVKQSVITINRSNYTVSGSGHFGSVQWVNPRD